MRPKLDSREGCDGSGFPEEGRTYTLQTCNFKGKVKERCKLCSVCILYYQCPLLNTFLNFWKTGWSLERTGRIPFGRMFFRTYTHYTICTGPKKTLSCGRANLHSGIYTTYTRGRFTTARSLFSRTISSNLAPPAYETPSRERLASSPNPSRTLPERTLPISVFFSWS